MTRPPAVAEMLGVWDAQGPYPLRSTDDVAQLIAWVKTLEQRIDAAQAHLRTGLYEGDPIWFEGRSHFAEALDALNGEATA